MQDSNADDYLKPPGIVVMPFPDLCRVTGSSTILKCCASQKDAHTPAWHGPCTFKALKTTSEQLKLKPNEAQSKLLQMQLLLRDLLRDQNKKGTGAKAYCDWLWMLRAECPPDCVQVLWCCVWALHESAVLAKYLFPALKGILLMPIISGGAQIIRHRPYKPYCST